MTTEKTRTGSKGYLKNAVYESLKYDIVHCRYKPGSLLNEANIASDYGLSRTPVREAISILETEGFLQILPKKGIFVTDIVLSDVLQIFQTRLEIEPICVRLAAPSLPIDDLIRLREGFRRQSKEKGDEMQNLGSDTEMHLFIIDHCGNDYIIDMMHKVFDKNTRVIITSKENKDHIKEAQAQHIEILNSLIEQDAEHAARLMREHIMTCRRAALDQFYK